jgi:hypothetical protein
MNDVDHVFEVNFAAFPSEATTRPTVREMNAIAAPMNARPARCCHRYGARAHTQATEHKRACGLREVSHRPIVLRERVGQRG